MNCIGIGLITPYKNLLVGILLEPTELQSFKKNCAINKIIVTFYGLSCRCLNMLIRQKITNLFGKLCH